MDFSIVFAELIGTMVLILLGNGVVANVLLKKNKGFQSGWIVITAGWGFAVAIGVYLIGFLTGAHLNPAVTLGLVTAGITPSHLMLSYWLGQLLGAFTGAILVYLSYYCHFNVTEDKDSKLMCFCTKPAIYQPVWNLITEMLGTAVLMLGVLGIIASANNVPKFFTPYLFGILVFAIGLSLGGPTGYAINPARDLGPRIAHAILPMKNKGDSDWKYAWVPIFGPFLGSLLGVAIYMLLMRLYV